MSMKFWTRIFSKNASKQQRDQASVDILVFEFHIWDKKLRTGFFIGENY